MRAPPVAGLLVGAFLLAGCASSGGEGTGVEAPGPDDGAFLLAVTWANTGPLPAWFSVDVEEADAVGAAHEQRLLLGGELATVMLGLARGPTYHVLVLAHMAPDEAVVRTSAGMGTEWDSRNCRPGQVMAVDFEGGYDAASASFGGRGSATTCTA